jgi:hypothetical protein
MRDDRAFLDGVVSPLLAAEGEKALAKFSYEEQRELEALPGEIEALEAEQKRSAEIEALLMQKLERWEALEAKAALSLS